MRKKSRPYIPDRGDLIWVTLAPTAGHEQSGRRPALVLSPKSYNSKTRLCVLCPATSQAKGYPFEVVISGLEGNPSVLLADHLRNVDWSSRQVDFIKRVSDAELNEVIGRIEALLISPDS